jgi:hypothetical protein
MIFVIKIINGSLFSGEMRFATEQLVKIETINKNQEAIEADVRLD